MPNKQKVLTLVSVRNHRALVALAEENSSKVIRHIVRLTYSSDDFLHWRAIEALGVVCAAIADKDPERVLNVIRRFIWSMSDESGANCRSAPAAVAEIIFNRPDLYADFAPIMINAALDEELFQKGMLWGIGRLAGKISCLYDIVPKIEKFLQHSNPELRGYAAWALGQIGADGAVKQLEMLKDDPQVIKIYLQGELQQKTVGELANNAILAK